MSKSYWKTARGCLQQGIVINIKRYRPKPNSKRAARPERYGVVLQKGPFVIRDLELPVKLAASAASAMNQTPSNKEKS